MELKINLATATLKDAEHAIFLIGAYFGLTQSVTAGARVIVPAQDVQPAAVVNYPAGSQHNTPPEPYPTAQVAQPDPAAVFGAQPAPLSPDPAQVFGGNVATAPVGVPAIPGAASSVLPAAAAAVGDAGNVAPIAAAPVGLPAAPAPAPVASALPGVELDADGLPWDVRINAAGEGGAKPKNADGRWRKKRGLNDAALVARVQAELRATLAAPAAAAGTPPVAPVAPVAPVPPQPPVAVQPQPPVAPVAPVAPAGPPTTFEQLMPRITSAVTGGVIPNSALLQAVTAYQLPNIPALATRPDLVPTVWAYLQACYPALV